MTIRITIITADTKPPTTSIDQVEISKNNNNV